MRRGDEEGVRSRRGRPEGIIRLSGHRIVPGEDTAGTDPIPNIRERSERFTSQQGSCAGLAGSSTADPATPAG